MGTPIMMFYAVREQSSGLFLVDADITKLTLTMERTVSKHFASHRRADDTCKSLQAMYPGTKWYVYGHG